MKSVKNIDTPKKESPKLSHIGTSKNPVITYSKRDFLTPEQVAEKFKLATAEAQKLMKKMMTKRGKGINSFMLNGHESKAVVTLGRATEIYLHPMGVEAFKQFLTKELNHEI